MCDLLAEFACRKNFKLAIFLLLPGLAFAGPQLSFAAAAVAEVNTAESSLELSNRQAQQLALFRQQIDALEIEFGPYHQALLEPLQGLVQLYLEAEDLEAVGRTLNRRLQLFRVTYGPESLAQLPDLAVLISNNIRRQRWQEVTDSFENIHWLQTQNPEADPARLLESLNAVGAWHFTAIYLDDPRQRARHFKNASEIQQRLLDLAEAQFGEESAALIPWLYQDVLEHFRKDAFFSAKDELGAQTRSTIFRFESPRAGLNRVKRMRRVIESMNNAEAAAMAMVYEADFQMLLKLGTAPRLYRNAMEKLEETGISKAKIEAFFARPVVLPEPKFYFSIEEALQAQSAYGYTVQAGAEGADDVIHMGDFIAWNESLPYARRPEIPQLAASVSTELYVIEMKFTIDSVGNVRTPRPQSAEPDNARVRRNAKDAIEEMQFRPKFANGRGYRTRDVTMRYLYPPPL